MIPVKVAVLNQSTVLTDDQVSAIVPALQVQVSQQFAPIWGTEASLKFFASGSPPDPSAWWLAMLDDSDQAGALGYHDLTPQGLPMGKVFAGSDLELGNQWTITASHELLEMLADPDIDLTVFVQADATSGTLYAYEVCDPCEADEYGYPIDGTLVSDFIYPAWFESFHAPGSTQFDYAKKIQKPFEILPGGYIGTYDVTSGTGWHQVTAEGALLRYDMRARVGSRRERRRLPRSQWLASDSGRRGAAPSSSAPTAERRLRDMEKKLDQILEELEGLRPISGEVAKRPPRRPSPPASPG